MTTESESAKSAKRELAEQEVQEELEMVKVQTEQEELTKQERRSEEQADNEENSDKDAQTAASSECVKSSYSIDDINYYLRKKIRKLSFAFPNILYIALLIPTYLFYNISAFYFHNCMFSASDASAGECANGIFYIYHQYLFFIFLIILHIIYYFKSKRIVNNWAEMICHILSSKTEFSDISGQLKLIRCKIDFLFISNRMFKVVLFNIISIILSDLITRLIYHSIQTDPFQYIYMYGVIYNSRYVCIVMTIFVLLCYIFALIINLIKSRYFCKRSQRSVLNN